MSSVVIAGDTSGTITVSAPAVSGSNTLTLPAVTANVATDVNGALYPLKSGTAVASTSGTSIDFTSIPSWVKRITVMFNGVSTNGTSLMQVQIGTSGGVVSSGYTSTAASDGAKQAITTGIALTGYTGSSSNTIFGAIEIYTLGSNIWVCSGVTNRVVIEQNSFIAGGVTLGGTLDRVRITTVNGTDTFDAGSINILYE